MSVTSSLFKAARLSADVRSLRSPQTAARRARNKLVGRMLARTGVWNRL